MNTIKLIFIVALGVIMNSPTPTSAGPMSLLNEKALQERRATIAKAKDPDAGVTYAQIKADLDDVATALEAVQTAIDAIDVTTIDPAVFTGTQKTCVQNLKGAFVALKQATRNLKVAAKNNEQATTKLVKKLKESERIDKEAK